jgi:hypothetical protein
MNDPSTLPGGPWRLLALDPDHGGDDPKWMLATITDPGDVRPAAPGETVTDVASWVNSRYGTPYTLTRLPGARCWRIDGPRADQSY